MGVLLVAPEGTIPLMAMNFGSVVGDTKSVHSQIIQFGLVVIDEINLADKFRAFFPLWYVLHVFDREVADTFVLQFDKTFYVHLGDFCN